MIVPTTVPAVGAVVVVGPDVGGAIVPDPAGLVDVAGAGADVDETAVGAMIAGLEVDGAEVSDEVVTPWPTFTADVFAPEPHAASATTARATSARLLTVM